MNKITLNVIEKQVTPLKHLENLDLLRALGNGRTHQNILLFVYGRIVGIQEERARRNKKNIEIPSLVDDSMLQLQQEFHNMLKDDYTLDEIEEALKHFIRNYYKQNSEIIPSDIEMMLKTVVALEKIEKK